MTVMMDTNRPPMGAQEELAGTLQMLLDQYLAIVTHRPWTKDEQDTVRTVRDVLIRAGYEPNLSYEVRSHLDSPRF